MPDFIKDRRIQEILNRKPSRWGNLSIKTFEQDIKILVDTVVKQEKRIQELEGQLKKE